MTVSYKLLGVPYVVAQSAVASTTLTGSTNETTLQSVTVPGGSIGLNGRVIITGHVTYNNSVGTKTIRVKFGGTTYHVLAPSTTANYKFRIEIQNVNSLSSQIGAPSTLASFGASTGANVTSTVDTSSDVQVLFTGQLSTGTDDMTLRSYSVEVVYGA